MFRTPYADRLAAKACGLPVSHERSASRTASHASLPIVFRQMTKKGKTKSLATNFEVYYQIPDIDVPSISVHRFMHRYLPVGVSCGFPVVLLQDGCQFYKFPHFNLCKCSLFLQFVVENGRKLHKKEFTTLPNKVSSKNITMDANNSFFICFLS